MYYSHGLSLLIRVSLVLGRINLGERWPLLVSIAVILAVLFYMELLIRRTRSLR
jgi:hypothetical protein